MFVAWDMHSDGNCIRCNDSLILIAVQGPFGCHDGLHTDEVVESTDILRAFGGDCCTPKDIWSYDLGAGRYFAGQKAVRTMNIIKPILYCVG